MNINILRMVLHCLENEGLACDKRKDVIWMRDALCDTWCCSMMEKQEVWDYMFASISEHGVITKAQEAFQFHDISDNSLQLTSLKRYECMYQNWNCTNCLHWSCFPLWYVLHQDDCMLIVKAEDVIGEVIYQTNGTIYDPLSRFRDAKTLRVRNPFAIFRDFITPSSKITFIIDDESYSNAMIDDQIMVKEALEKSAHGSIQSIKIPVCDGSEKEKAGFVINITKP